MRILFADALSDGTVAALQEAGHDCVIVPDCAAGDLPDAVAGVEVVVVRSTKVTAETIIAGDRLRLVIRAGSGTNTIDCDAAARRGVAVSNVPGRNAIAVAELAFALVMALDRRIPEQVADLRAGRWDKRTYRDARGLAGRRVGVVGLGAIGLAFAERARAFDMQLLSIARPDRDPRVAGRASALGIRPVRTLQDLARSCDILSFHVPLTEATRGMVNRDLLGQCRDGAWIINTSRGELVDDAALVEAMDARGLRAGIDVFNGEPAAGEGAFASPLAQHPNVYGTHHVGASTDQAQQAIADEVVRMIAAFEAGEVRHCVNGVDPVPRAPARA